jgi:L-fucose mutarotase
LLKGIPSVIPPELLKILAEMGHGDSLVIGDGNFPGSALAKRCVRCDGCGTAEMLEAILKVIPLDSYSEYQVGLMEVVQGDPGKPAIWETYKSIISRYEDKNNHIEFIERFAFYERAKEAYAVVMTSETALYANVFLKKGVVVGDGAD